MSVHLIHHTLPFTGESRNFSRFVILTYPRTGSNFLIYSLQFTKQIVCFNELFYSKKKLVSSYPDLIFPLWVALYRNTHTHGFLNEIFKSYQRQIKAVGFKLTYSQDYTFRKKNLIPLLAETYQTSFIHLKRKNLLKCYVSKKLMDKTSIVYAVNSPFIESFYKHTHRFITRSALNNYTPSLHVDTNEFLAFINDINHKQSYYDKKIQDYSHITVFYEDLIKNTEQVIQDIGLLLNIPSLYVQPDTQEFPILKLNTRPLKEIIINYNEVADFLIKNKLEQYLEN